jgi:hypothetical protein
MHCSDGAQWLYAANGACLSSKSPKAENHNGLVPWGSVFAQPRPYAVVAERVLYCLGGAGEHLSIPEALPWRESVRPNSVTAGSRELRQQTKDS